MCKTIYFFVSNKEDGVKSSPLIRVKFNKTFLHIGGLIKQSLKHVFLQHEIT